MELRDILTKRPFTRILPSIPITPSVVRSLDNGIWYNTTSNAYYEVVYQSEFLQQESPSGHKINSEDYYPDKVKYDEKTEQYYKEKVFRASFPFQRIILTQQLVHLCGNDIHTELTARHSTDEDKSLLLRWRQGWIMRNLELCFYELAKSVKKTGDGASVMYMNNGKVGWKALSYAYGDTLYPHYDSITGELQVFARQYNAYDENGGVTTSFVEVWDDRFLYTYKRGEVGINGVINSIKGIFGLDGYTLVSKVPHGFTEVPVVYERDDSGPCWAGSQDSIDKYELAVSHLCQNNMAYAFPIMLLKGDEIDIQADVYGAVKAITMGKDDNASYLEPMGNAELFKLQLDTLLKNIFQGSFAVMAPEVKSGDLPGVAIKLIYSPSIDKAMNDAKFYDKAIDKLVRLFSWGYGIELGIPTRMKNLNVYAWIEPYVHQNQAELVNNLCMLVNSQLLSRDTGCQLSGYGENNEFDKIVREYKEIQAHDLLNDLGNNTSPYADTNATGNNESETTAE